MLGGPLIALVTRLHLFIDEMSADHTRRVFGVPRVRGPAPLAMAWPGLVQGSSRAPTGQNKLCDLFVFLGF